MVESSKINKQQKERGWKNESLIFLPGFNGLQQQLRHGPVFIGTATSPPPFSLLTSMTRMARVGQTFKSQLFWKLVFHRINKMHFYSLKRPITSLHTEYCASLQKLATLKPFTAQEGTLQFSALVKSCNGKVINKDIGMSRWNQIH